MNRKQRETIGRLQFSAALSMKDAWCGKGNQLLRGAKVLLERLWYYKEKAAPLLKETRNFAADDPNWEVVQRSLLEPTVSLLVAYAIENFLKGAWAHQNHAKVASASKLPVELTKDSGHNLNQLCDDIGIVLTPAEREALRVLSEFGRWRGRYNTDKTADRNAQAWADARNLTLISRKYPGEIDWPDEVNSILEKIAAKLE